MRSYSSSPLALLAFGLVALLGLIVLAGTGHLTDSMQTTLTSIVTLSIGGAAGASMPRHEHTPPPAAATVLTPTP